MLGKKFKMIGFIFYPTFFYLALARSVELEIERQKSSIVNRPEALPPDARNRECAAPAKPHMASHFNRYRTPPTVQACNCNKRSVFPFRRLKGSRSEYQVVDFKGTGNAMMGYIDRSKSRLKYFG